jgi:hypothetical protein
MRLQAAPTVANKEAKKQQEREAAEAEATNAAGSEAAKKGEERSPLLHATNESRNELMPEEGYARPKRNRSQPKHRGSR